jgi:hypothetical protein
VSAPSLVSLLTPTFNRRAFFPTLVACVLEQSYTGPMEWIVVDDGTDKVGDLLESHAESLAARDIELRYVAVVRRMPLGRKRNMLGELARGEVCIFVDDDDYHPPQRVQHSFDTLLARPEVPIAGCSELLILEAGRGESVSGGGEGVSPPSLHRIGPFGSNHATCGTMAVRRSYLETHKFADRSGSAEEEGFTLNFTVPIAQLRPESTLVCIAHQRNTVDKGEAIRTSSEPHTTQASQIISPSALRFYAGL